MLNEQLLKQWSAVHQGQAPEVNPEIVELSHTLSRQGVLPDPYATPSGETPDRRNATVRRKLLNGLAAIAITISLFAGGVAALVAPAPALATPAHMILE